MISNISFGSTFKVSSKNNTIDKFCKFQAYAASQDYSDGVYSDLKVRQLSTCPFEYKALYTLVTPDNMDDEVEMFCTNRGIEFKKLNTKDLMQQKALLDRIKPAPEEMIKTKIDADKLAKLIKNQTQNIDYCKEVYSSYYSQKVDKILKLGDKFPATSFYIIPNGSDIDETIRYINRFGAENLNDKQLSFMFSQKTNNPDHCIFFALSDLGLKDIPVYVNQDTYRIAEALGILK